MDNSEFKTSVDAATRKIIAQLVANMAAAALKVEGTAKKECPVDMGVLRASITSSVKQSPDEITGYIGSQIEYAPFVHQGTGIYAKNGDGRKTGWYYKKSTGAREEYRFTRGQRPNQFLERAKLKEKDNISSILAKGV